MFKKFFRDHPIHKKIVPLFDEFFFFNPMNYYFSWLMICVGVYLNLFLSQLNPQFLFSFNFGYLLLFLGLSMILSSFYIFNKIYDVNERDENFKHIETKYSFEKFELLIKILIFVGLLLLLFVSIINTIVGVLLIICFGICKKYFKNKLIYYFSESCLLFFSGWFYTKKIITSRFFLLNDIIFLLPYFLFYLSLYMSKINLNNYSNENFKIKKFDWKILCPIILVSISFYLGFINSDPLISIISITSIGFNFYSFFRFYKKDMVRSLIYPLALFNIFLMTIFPYLFIFHFILFYISKYYHWHRFDLHYPTFLVDSE